MPFSQEELALFESVVATGICHDVILQWSRFDDGTGVEVPIAKARTVCPVCLREYIKSVQVVDLDQI